MEELGGKILVICGILIVCFILWTKDWYGPSALIFEWFILTIFSMVATAIIGGTVFLVYKWWKRKRR